MNMGVVLWSGQHAVLCVAVGVLGAIFPGYLLIIAATGNNHMWRPVFRHSSDSIEFTAIVDTALPTLITVSTVSALILLLTVIYEVHTLIKDKKQHHKLTTQTDPFQFQLDKFLLKSI